MYIKTKIGYYRGPGIHFNNIDCPIDVCAELVGGYDFCSASLAPVNSIHVHVLFTRYISLVHEKLVAIP